LTKHVGFVYAYAKKAKNRQINDEKGGVDSDRKPLYSTLVSCSTHLQSCAKVDNETKLDKLRTVAQNKS